MNRKQLIIIIVAPVIAILLGFGVYYYFRATPVEEGVGLFPGEGQLVGLDAGEGADEEVNIPFFVPGTGMTPPRLYELHKVPVAGVGFMETGLPSAVIQPNKTKMAKKPVVPAEPHTVNARYIERGLGHIYETPLATLVETRIVNETRPRIAEAFFGGNGKTVAVRYLEEEFEEEVIKTRILNLFSGSATTSSFIKTEEVFLPDRIPFLAAAEDTTGKFFYLTRGLTTSSGFLTTSKGEDTAVFDSSFTEWLPQFPNQNLVALASRPSSAVSGALFFLDTKTRALSRILDGLPGLTAKVSHDGKRVLYSTTREGKPELFVYDVEKKESTDLFVQTLPEKCAWSMKDLAVVYCAIPDSMDQATYPDQWYRGTISFSDSMWRINTGEPGFTDDQKIFTPSEYRAGPLDIINPVLPSDDSYILFMNKLSSTPWVYRLAELPVITPVSAGATSTVPTTPSTTTPVSLKSTTEGMVKIK